MPNAWSSKRERQYEEIKKSETKQGRSPATAKRIAAATVNKTRSEKGETKGATPARKPAPRAKSAARARSAARSKASPRATAARRRPAAKKASKAPARKRAARK